MHIFSAAHAQTKTVVDNAHSRGLLHVWTKIVKVLFKYIISLTYLLSNFTISGESRCNAGTAGFHLVNNILEQAV